MSLMTNSCPLSPSPAPEPGAFDCRDCASETLAGRSPPRTLFDLSGVRPDSGNDAGPTPGDHQRTIGLICGTGELTFTVTW